MNVTHDIPTPFPCPGQDYPLPSDTPYKKEEGGKAVQAGQDDQLRNPDGTVFSTTPLGARQGEEWDIVP